MAKKTTSTAAGLRRCIGSAKYGIAPHEAPIEDFPKQPSQKDGLGRMCKTHWNQYTAGLARDRKARLAAEDPVAAEAPAKAATKRERRRTPMAHAPESEAAPRRAKRQTAAVGTEVRPGMFKVGEGEYLIAYPLAPSDAA